MIKFISLEGDYTFKWEFVREESSSFGFRDEHKHTCKCTYYRETTIKGPELIDWMQTYGLTPDQMFNGQDLFHGEKVSIYELDKEARRWAAQNAETIKNNPWTVVGMNGGYVLISNGSKENTVELGSASVVNLEMNNSNAVKNNPNISVSASASLI